MARTSVALIVNLLIVGAACGPGALAVGLDEGSSTSTSDTDDSLSAGPTTLPPGDGDGEPSGDGDPGGDGDGEPGDGDGDGDGDGEPGDGDGDGDPSPGQQGDIFDPDRVYLVGTLSEGACYRDAIAHWSTPNDAAVGFDCYFNGRGAVIRPTDGRLLYTNTFEDLLREFHCDDCPYQGGYPNAPLANDLILPTPACEPGRFKLRPSGAYIYQCNTDWYDAEGELAYDGSYGHLLHLGYGDLALAEDGLVELYTFAPTPLVGELDLITDFELARADPEGGFLVVVDPGNFALRLVHVDVDGQVEVIGDYPPPPAQINLSWAKALRADGVLFQSAHGPAVFQDIILRREVGGASEVVYDEADEPLVKMHASGLVTGP